MKKRAFKEVIGPHGLLPLYSLDMSNFAITDVSEDVDLWLLGYQEKAEKWRSTAYEWLKVHHREAICIGSSTVSVL